MLSLYKGLAIAHHERVCLLADRLPHQHVRSVRPGPRLLCALPCNPHQAQSMFYKHLLNE